MRRRLCLIALLVCLAQLSCRRPAPAPAFITSPGYFRYFDDGLKIEVREAQGQRIEYRISRAKVSVEPGSSSIRSGSKWFIHPATENSVWVFDGADDLLLIQVDENGASKFSSSKVIRDLTNRAPAEVVQRLQPAQGSGL